MTQKLDLPYPVSTNIYWRTYRNIQTISKAGLNFKKYAKAVYCKLRPTNNFYKIDIIIHPKLTKKNVEYKKLIDLDNGFKCVLDSLIGIIYHDDKQVKSLSACYGEPIKAGGCTVFIEEFK